ncbi:hypothetical protein PCASD_02790 [Puccinia coronata f. sp. avenae]|uniref:DNA 3'-5' helicase n=1 Tax=Puccinia coronata f. sp. avenae TaxID=200324 RepID=A0A2N5VFV3_9BASI|nr:hypothetical protein PCASD_02790 [Puccinia coronata f. sp. avenae]
MIIDGAVELLSGSKQRVALPKKLLALSRDELKDHIKKMANGICEDEAKEGQIDAVAHLVHSEHTFVLAGTGFGKTQIAEMYSKLFKPYQKAVIVVVNPLDALGDNQVEEKKDVGVDHKTIQAINLTKDTLTGNVAKQITRGDFSFIYVSPEAFLNSEML